MKKKFLTHLFFKFQGDIIHNYDKIKLVPFGEYIPLENI